MSVLTRVKSLRVAVVVAVIAIVAGYSCWSVAEERSARRELLTFRERISTLRTRADVEQVFSSGQYKYIKLAKTQTDKWIVMTPVTFGAKNWDLHLGFDDEQLRSIRVRIADSADVAPPGGPTDIVR